MNHEDKIGLTLAYIGAIILTITMCIQFSSAIYPGETQVFDLSPQLVWINNISVINNVSEINVTWNGTMVYTKIPNDYPSGTFDLIINGLQEDKTPIIVYQFIGGGGGYVAPKNISKPVENQIIIPETKPIENQRENENSTTIISRDFNSSSNWGLVVIFILVVGSLLIIFVILLNNSRKTQLNQTEVKNNGESGLEK